mgnify:CR=1 FL=1
MIIVKVLHPFQVAEASRLMTDMPTLAHYFEERGPNSWNLKLEYESESKQAIAEVERYFIKIKYRIVYE